MRIFNIFFRCLNYDGGIYNIGKMLKKILYIVCILTIVLNNIKIELFNIKITMSEKVIYLANTKVLSFVIHLLVLIFLIGILNTLLFKFEFKKYIAFFK